MGLFADVKDWLNLETRDYDGMTKAEGVTRLFFATDIHGSSVCWRKFVNAADFYHADILVLGGDTTGKAIFPIVESNGRFTYTRDGTDHEITDGDELAELENTLANRGYYPIVVDSSEYDRIRDDDAYKEEVFHREMRQRIGSWCAFASERLVDEIKVYVCPGNDDPFEIDETWDACESVSIVEDEVVTLPGGWEMASSGWTNQSPWDTYREEPEDKLKARLERVVAGIDDMDRAIFNFHDPPYDSRLDEAPELDDELRPKYAGHSLEPVGSTAVRELIEEHQPPLSLHGHIHESRGKVRIGKTIAINPGSVYSEGSLQGAVIDIDPELKVRGLVRG